MSNTPARASTTGWSRSLTMRCINPHLPLLLRSASREKITQPVCALIHYYVHKKKRLNEQYLLTLNTIRSLANQDVEKLVDTRFEREKASYDTGYATQLGLAQTALSDARDFVMRVREILEDGLGREFLKDV